LAQIEEYPENCITLSNRIPYSAPYGVFQIMESVISMFEMSKYCFRGMKWDTQKFEKWLIGIMNIT